MGQAKVDQPAKDLAFDQVYLDQLALQSFLYGLLGLPLDMHDM
jgi:hypothetical protein